MALQPADGSSEKRIELCTMRARDIQHGFGNPRKIRKAEREKLRKSMEMFGDFGVYVIDENDNIICGWQRLGVVMDIDPDMELNCKRLIGYTESELKAINIKDNTHAGEWDLDLLADWTADLQIDLGITPKEKNPEDRKIKDMELIRYEKYDYVMIVCRNEVDYLNLTRALGIDGGKVLIAKHRKIKARAIWYDDIAAQISPKATTSHNIAAGEEDKK